MLVSVPVLVSVIVVLLAAAAASASACVSNGPIRRVFIAESTRLPPVSVIFKLDPSDPVSSTVSSVTMLPSPTCSIDASPVTGSKVTDLVAPVVSVLGSNPPTVLASNVLPVYILLPFSSKGE